MVVFRPGAAPPAFGDIPFPSDAYRSDAGITLDTRGLDRLMTQQLETFRDGFAALDGFGRTTAVSFFVEGSLDPTSISPDALLLVDIDPGSPSHGRVYPARGRYLPTLDCISMAPSWV